jgi:histone H3/H4
LATPATAVPDNIDDGKEDQEDNEAGDIEIPGVSYMIDKVVSILDETSCPSGKRAKSHVPRLSGKPPSNYKSDGQFEEVEEAEQSLTPYSDALVLCENKPTPLNKSIAAAEASDVSRNQRNPAAAPEYRRSMRAHATRNSEELVFSQRSFAEVVRCLTMDPDVSPSASSQGDARQIRFQREALICLQVACEAFLQESFTLSQLFASHAKRNTLHVADWKLAQLTSADRQVFANNPSSSSFSSSRPAADRQVANNPSSSSSSSLQPTRATQQGEKRKVEAPGPKKPAKRSRS